MKHLTTKRRFRKNYTTNRRRNTLQRRIEMEIIKLDKNAEIKVWNPSDKDKEELKDKTK